MLHYTIHLRPEPEGGFTVTVPALPGCVTYGRDVEEARTMVADAIQGYIESLRADGEPIPTDAGAFTSSIEVTVAPLHDPEAA